MILITTAAAEFGSHPCLCYLCFLLFNRGHGRARRGERDGALEWAGDQDGAVRRASFRMLALPLAFVQR
jgi:hypothetical protein